MSRNWQIAVEVGGLHNTKSENKDPSPYLSASKYPPLYKPPPTSTQFTGSKKLQPARIKISCF